MTASSPSQLISISPDELRFHFELDKQIFCDLKVLNNTETYVAFKVKTTSPKKYFVRPNTGVVQPWDSCIIRVTLQAQREYPPDMQCKDKFLLQSTIVNPNTDVDELPPDTFTKDSGNSIEELKLRVAYISPNSPEGSSEDNALKNSTQKLDASSYYFYRDDIWTGLPRRLIAPTAEWWGCICRDAPMLKSQCFTALEGRKRCRCQTNQTTSTGTGHAEKAKKPK